MTAVKWNHPTALTVSYIGANVGVLTLAPGINFGIDESELSAFVLHPIVKSLLDDRSIQILDSTPDTKHEITGLAVVDDAATGQPMPVQEASTSVKSKKSAAVMAQLEALKEAGEAA
jgi:hypothetical protein